MLAPAAFGGPFQWNYTYANETRAAMAAFTTPPTGPRAQLYDALIRGLIADGTYAGITGIYIPAAETIQAGQSNLRQRTFDLVATGTGTWTQDRGYVGDAGSYWAAAVGINNMIAQNSAYLGAWVNTGAVSDSPYVGTSTTAPSIYLINRATTTVLRTRVNDATSSDSTVGTVTNALGWRSVSREAAGTYRQSKDGASLGTISVASTAVATEPLTLSRGGPTGNTTTARIAAVVTGSGMTQAQDTAIYNRIATFLNAIGAA